MSHSSAVAKQSLKSLQWFATEDQIGTALLGANRLHEWRQIAPLLEARGLPKIDQLMGSRYMPAVRAFFDRLYGLDHTAADVPLAPDGVEDFGSWKTRKKNRPS